MKAFKTIILTNQREALFITLNRPEAKNSINSTMVLELTEAMEIAERDSTLKVIVFKGNNDVFCTGMDFNAISDNRSDALIENDPNGYYNLLKKISMSSKSVVAQVDGKVNAGGIGIVAACDMVIASEKSTFGLSEALFGLLPACVMPFLIRRIGSQKAQWMALITQVLPAQRAYEIGLVDEVNLDTFDSLRRALLRLSRLETRTILDLKNYMAKLWIINEDTQRLAVNKISSLVASDVVKNNIENFVKNGRFPWDK